MNIFIKYFCILPILISLNSSMEVHIEIEKKELKNVPKRIKNYNGQFLSILAKWSENGQWEYGHELARSDSPVLTVPSKWEEPYRKEKGTWQPFMLALKMEMVNNEEIEIEHIPFIMVHTGQFVKFHLREENGKIVGWSSGYDQRINAEIIKEFIEKVEREKKADIGKYAHKEFMAKATLSMRNNPDRFHFVQKWHDNNPEQKFHMIEKMKIEGSEIGRSNDGGNSAVQMPQLQHFQQHYIPQKYHIFAQGHQSNLIPAETQNVQRPGKRAMSEIGEGEAPLIGNHPQKKLMQSAMSASQKEWKRLQRHFGQVDRKHGKGVEIGDDNHPLKQEEFLPLSPISSHLHEHPEHGNLAPTLAGHFLNEVLGTFTEEYEAKPNEFAQFNQSGFTHQQGNKSPMNANADKRIEGREQNSQNIGQIQKERIGPSADEYGEFGQFIESGFTHHQGNIPPTDAREDPSMMEEWQQNLNFQPNLPSTPTESMAGRQHEYTQIYPTGTSHQGQRKIPMNKVESTGHENMQPIHTAKISSSFDVASSQQNLGNEKGPSKHSTSAIGDDVEESDLASNFYQEQPTMDQIMSESPKSEKS